MFEVENGNVVLIPTELDNSLFVVHVAVFSVVATFAVSAALVVTFILVAVTRLCRSLQFYRHFTEYFSGLARSTANRSGVW